MRDSLSTHLDNVLKPRIRELADNGVFTHERLNQLLGKSDISTINEAFRTKIAALEASDKISNATIYKCALNTFENFAGVKPFSAITPKFLREFQEDMEKREMRKSSMGMYLRCLRAVVNNNGESFLPGGNYPFGKGKFVIPTGSGREMALNLNDIHKLEEYECKSKTIELCRDMWLFSFYCSGVNFSDLCRMKHKDIENDEIHFIRQKTKSTTQDQKDIVSPIIEPMRRIILRHANKESKGYIFPMLNGTKTEAERINNIRNFIRLTNRKIKDIAKDLKLMDGISTYTARHSYATILAKLRVPESFISEQLGHSKRSVTQGYFDSYSREERFKYNGLLTSNNNL
jgi:integrase